MSRVSFATRRKLTLCIAKTTCFCVDNTNVICHGLVCFQHGKVSLDIKREPFNRMNTFVLCLDKLAKSENGIGEYHCKCKALILRCLNYNPSNSFLLLLRL